MLNWHDILERALWTAVQAFVAAVPAGFVLTDLGTWKIAGLAGITAGIGFILSTFKNMARQRLED